jgi:hypothetical protein
MNERHEEKDDAIVVEGRLYLLTANAECWKCHRPRVPPAQMPDFGLPSNASIIRNLEKTRAAHSVRGHQLAILTSMVRKVRDRFHVSADVLIGPPRLRKGLAA